jgi:DNA modification methylase
MGPVRPRHRRALTGLAGTKTARGGGPESVLLESALQVAADPDTSRLLTHGFHTYPARMHPLLARRLIASLSPVGGVVLDPFCGGGTVLVEARAAGRRALGSDVNPLAVRLAALKAGGLANAKVAAIPSAAEAIAERAGQKGAPARGPARRGPALFDPHVFRELAGLRAALDQEADRAVREALELCLSAILVKVSRQRSDTSGELAEKRIARGFASRLFVGKARELELGLRALAKVAPPATPLAEVHVADARHLAFVSHHAVDLVLTSPPYVGTYDYVEHQRLRYDWLGMDPGFAEKHEIGARRRGVASTGRADFERDLGASLAELARVLKPSGSIVVELGDSAAARGPSVDVRPLFERAAAHAGLSLVAWADAPRRAPGPPTKDVRSPHEHLLLLRPGP